MHANICRYVVSNGHSGKTIHAAVGRIALVMCLACASAGLVQTLISGLVQIYKRDTTINANEIANVVLGGLVAVTGCCPFIDPRYAILIGGELSMVRNSYIMK